MAAPKPDRLVLPHSSVVRPTAGNAGTLPDAPPLLNLPPATLVELWIRSDAAAYELTREELFRILLNVGNNFNFGLTAETYPNQEEQVSFLWHLRLSDLALAAACALGREAAWKRFFLHYRAALTQAAIAISRSQAVGNDLAESLYAELYGLRGGEGARRSLLASYSGRGSLLGWLRTILAQRHGGLYRRTHREIPIDTLNAPAPGPTCAPLTSHLLHLKRAVTQTFMGLKPEDRFLLAAYFLDERSQPELAAILDVDKDTIGRRIKRLSADLRDELLGQLQAGGLSIQGAEEAVGIDLDNDSRDFEINLRWLLQSSQSLPLPIDADRAQASKESEPPIEGSKRP